MELKVISAQDLAKMNPDKSYFLPWNVDMLYQVEPGLKEIANKALAYKGQKFEKRLNAYTNAKEEAERLVGWGARDPRLRSEGAWDCFFNYVWDQLNIPHADSI